ncbi:MULTISPECIES: phosphate ABC transporter substrate-binding protein [unclassified Lactobacillus]|uniref:phosphate ABC transporter substrate-binding protein n=1 Tax=unclassified Lactobacillus TaxID=2620435 RepID=UPI000EFCD963|nr:MULTISPECIES: phosphate ABC transporter substrate-binding protein [unclassified Lactobacillus]RMC38413.1 phosphate ABC transporter substrate-binding protein [Lactobacillus sp. ESL0237]RMC40931.1 phosphate ABC transporter substrate-binding protein [Lactobacillus sp. ESL0233]RMC43221.1 phosphate ABC transporter substrate-binding protein [Lactobacillus sp. ESL0234]RMC44248.1 phosphate ABC transporter substrate-binding protein [Lactobacillus sp. ESL0236]RMC45229.1 phosphate ABC transporter subs
MRKSNFVQLLACCLLVPLFLVGCSKNGQKITIVGSSALQPLIEQAGNDYHLAHLNSNIVVQGGGSGTGLSQVQAGAVEVGTSDVFAETQKGIDAQKLKDYPVAIVGIVPIANKAVGIKNLSKKQLADIFTGKIKNWHEVGGKNLPIIVINRSRGSGTRSTFEDLILNGKDAVNSQEQDSNGSVKKIVNSTPGTISYISFPYANDQNIQKISINHVVPDNKNIPSNKWPLWSYEHMYTKGKPNKATAAFIDYVLSPKVQKEVVPKIGYLSINEMKVVRDSQNKVSKIRN